MTPDCCFLWLVSLPTIRSTDLPKIKRVQSWWSMTALPENAPEQHLFSSFFSAAAESSSSRFLRRRRSLREMEAFIGIESALANPISLSVACWPPRLAWLLAYISDIPRREFPPPFPSVLQNKQIGWQKKKKRTQKNIFFRLHSVYCRAPTFLPSTLELGFRGTFTASL